MRFVELFQRYILRDLFRNRARIALTLSGIALGIGVVVAVQLANDRAIGSFNDSLRILAGQSDLEITSNGLPLPEDTMRRLSWVWDHGSMSAVIQGRGRAITDQDTIHILGVDLLSEAAFRTYVLDDESRLTDSITRDEFIELLLDPTKAIVTEALATRLGVGKGSTLPILLGDRRADFVVGAVLANDGIARAFSGDVIFLDIAAAQAALHQVGFLSRIDVKLSDQDELESIRRRIQSSLPDAAVDRPEAAQVRNEKLVRAFRYNLTALSYISLIVGIILVYNTLTIAVIRRRSEIGILRTLGTSRRTVAALFLAEAACLGLVGSVIGVALGEFMSVLAGALVTRTIQSLYTGIEVSSVFQAQPAFYAKAVLSGMLLSMISGLAPAIRSTGVSPVNVLRQGISAVSRTRTTNILAAAGLLLLATAVIASRQPPIEDLPVFGYFAAILLITGFGLLAPACSRLLLKLFAPVLRQALPVEGSLAIQSIAANLGRVATAVFSLALAVAMLISVVTMVSSFRGTVIVWINQTLRADIYIRAAAAGTNDWSNPFDPSTVQSLESLPAVAALDRFRGRPLNYNGTPVILGSGEFPVLAQHSDLLFMDGRTTAEVAQNMMGQNRVIVSEPFSLKQRVGRGDVIRLPTAEGIQSFTIEAVYYDYSNDTGLVVMDRSTWLRLLKDPSITNVAIYLKPGVDTSEAQRQIARALPDARLRITTNADLKQQVLRVFDETFQVTYALEVIALIVAILGITNTLSALILERRPEFAMLRFVGTDRRQLRNLVVLESGLTGVVGAALGLLLGIALSAVLVFVINKQSFGWTIQFLLPTGFFAQSLSLIILATVIAGLYPAALATRIDPIQSIRAE